MFQTKKAAAPVTAVKKSSGNKFLSGATKISSVTTSGNGAVKYTTSGSPFVDQLASAGLWIKPRTFAEAASDQSILWGENPLNALRFIGYLRAVTRTTEVMNQKIPVHGEGIKTESIYRMMWLAVFHKETFLKNLPVFVALGSWHDIFTMLQTDLVYNGWDNKVLPWNEITSFILTALNDPKQVNLVKKYLPHIKAASHCTTIEAQANNAVAKYLCARIFGNKAGDHTTYAKYRRMKATGNAHQWQQLISQARFNEIEFNKIAGKALSILVKSKTFLTKTNLRTKFSEWIGAKVVKGESVKTTDFVFDLLSPLGDNPEKHQIDLINQQFQTLIDNSGTMSDFPLIVVRDTSGSMGSQAIGLKVSANTVAKSIALQMSYFLKGEFSDSYIEFNSTALIRKWQGSTPAEKYMNDNCSVVSSTEFMKVINLFCDLKSQGVPEEDFPKGIVCISDGDFNKAALGKTNFETAKEHLRNYFSAAYVDNFKFVFWNVFNGFYSSAPKVKFESVQLDKNVYYFGGFSPSVIKFISGASNAEEAALSALDQDALKLLVL